VKRAAPTLWGVEVRRVERCTVYIESADPVEARRLALELADDFVSETTATAYPHRGEVNERIWRGDTWHYPETELFDEAL
jgi:hypothetical protein